MVGNLNFFFLFPDRTERWFDQAKFSRTVSCCAKKNDVSHLVFMYSLRFQIRLIRSKTQHLADLAGAIILNVIAPSTPTIRLLYMGIFEEGLGAPSALAFGRPESGITWAPAEKARPTNPMMAVFSLKDIPLGLVDMDQSSISNRSRCLRSEIPTK